MTEQFLSDSDPDELPSLAPQDSREWPEYGGIRIPEDEQEAEQLSRQLYECFKKLKSLSPPSSPENGPGSSENSASFEATDSGTPYCQGVLLDNLLLSPRENKHDGNLEYLEEEDWKKLKTLGKGFTGEVSKAQDQTTKFICAVKQILFKKYEPLEGFAWAQMDHPNIPKLYGIVREVNAEAANISDAGKVFLFCEEINNHKPFLDFIEDCKKQHRPSSLVRTFIQTVEKQVNSALAHIHSKGFAHNDLHIENVVIEDFDADKGSDRKAWVIDFGETAPATTEDDKGDDKRRIRQLFLRARMTLKEIEDEEEEVKKLKKEEEQERLEEIAEGMKDLNIEGAAGAASNLLPTVEPPDWSEPPMDGGGERVKGTGFTPVKLGGASSTASLSPSTSTSDDIFEDDIFEDDTQDEDQSTIAAPNNLEKNPFNPPSNENVPPREDPKHLPVSEIQPSRVENQ